MPPVPGFAIATVLVVAAVVVLARASQGSLTPDPNGGAWLGEDYRIGPIELYLNVVATQLLVVVAVLATVALTAVTWTDLGIGRALPTWHVLGGIGLGAVLYLGNEASVHLLDRLGIGYSEALRGALAPDSAVGWVMLLVVVLPVIALAEELLFRAALVGGMEASMGVSPWLLVAISSVLFALGHGIQGTGGIIVTGALGIVLGAAYVISASLVLVSVAHYVINLLEFVVHEGLGVDRVFGDYESPSSSRR